MTSEREVNCSSGQRRLQRAAINSEPSLALLGLCGGVSSAGSVSGHDKMYLHCWMGRQGHPDHAASPHRRLQPRSQESWRLVGVYRVGLAAMEWIQGLK